MGIKAYAVQAATSSPARTWASLFALTSLMTVATKILKTARRPSSDAYLEVAPIPTVLFSNTPHYPTLRGAPLPPDIFADLLRGANERGLAERADFILTGYIGSGEVAEITADFISKAKAVNPNLTYVCDPVLGDFQLGLTCPSMLKLYCAIACFP